MVYSASRKPLADMSHKIIKNQNKISGPFCNTFNKSFETQLLINDMGIKKPTIVGLAFACSDLITSCLPFVNKT